MDAEHLSTRHPAPNGAPTPSVRPATSSRVPAGQLRLLDTTDHPEWKLDDATRDVGRRGVAQARAALRAARGSDEHALDEQRTGRDTASSHHTHAA